jgi:hypothetical protein
MGHAWVTPGPPKRHAWVTLGSNGGSGFVCNKRWKMPGWGGARSAPIAGIAVIARDRKDKTLPLINTDYTDQKSGKSAATAEGGGATRVAPGLNCVSTLES